MTLLLQLSNWLSGGALDRYKKQFESAQVKLSKTLSELEFLSERFDRTQQELNQTKTKLQATQSQLESAQLECSKNSASTEANPDWLTQVNETVRVVALNYLPIEEPNALWGFKLGSPQLDMKINGGSIVVKGWILGKKASVNHFRISYGEEILAQIPVNLPSGWLAQKFPDLPEAKNSYFETALTISGAPEKAELLIEALFADRSSLAVATFQFQKLVLVAC